MMMMMKAMADEAEEGDWGRSSDADAHGRADIDGQIMAAPPSSPSPARSVILSAPHYSSRVLNRDRRACEWGSINAAAIDATALRIRK